MNSTIKRGSRLPIELVVFDMAGTTVNDEDSVSRCVHDALIAEGLTVTVADVNRVMGIPKPEALRILMGQSARHHALIDRLEAIHRDFVERSIRFYQTDPSVRAVSGAEQTFEILHRNGIKVALNTGFDRAITQTILDRLGWSSNALINATIASDEVPRGRPFPDMILALMSRLKIDDPGKVAKVGDTPADLQEGTNAGCGLVLGVTAGTHTKDQLESHPNSALIDSVRDVPRILGLHAD
jgi:phosphonatase-like hydrolase